MIDARWLPFIALWVLPIVAVGAAILAVAASRRRATLRSRAWAAATLVCIAGTTWALFAQMTP